MKLIILMYNLFFCILLPIVSGKPTITLNNLSKEENYNSHYSTSDDSVLSYDSYDDSYEDYESSRNDEAYRNLNSESSYDDDVDEYYESSYDDVVDEYYESSYDDVVDEYYESSYDDVDENYKIQNGLSNSESKDDFDTPMFKLEQFSYTIWKILEKFDETENLKTISLKNTIYSPISLFTSLIIIHAGADEIGKSEIESALQLQGLPISELVSYLNKVFESSDDYTIKAVNKLFVDDKLTLSQDFLKTYSNFSQISQKESISFAEPDSSILLINQYVEDQTKQLITNFLPEDVFNPLTKLYLVNVLYLQADWMRKFDESSNYESGFLVEHLNQRVPVTMMRNSLAQCSYHDYHEDLTVTVVPLAHDQIEMIFIQPNSMSNSTDLFENGAIILRSIFNELKDFTLQNCDLSFPKLQVSFEASEVVSSLQEMGIKKIFEQQGLPNIFNEDTNEAFVHEIRQKTVFKIDENGIQGASTTEIESMLLATSQKVIIDTPFYFVLRHKAQNAILYMGKYVDPLN